MENDEEGKTKVKVSVQPSHVNSTVDAGSLKKGVVSKKGVRERGSSYFIFRKPEKYAKLNCRGFFLLKLITILS